MKSWSGLSRREVLSGTAALAAAALVGPSGSAHATPTQTPRRGGTLRISQPYNPSSLDPIDGLMLPDFNVLYALYDPLVDYDPDTLELRPGLAKAWHFTDPKTLVLDLVSGVEFHDGMPFDAAAVKFNLDRSRTNPRSVVSTDLRTIADVVVTGKAQVTIRLSKPNSGLPAVLTHRPGLMVSPKWVSAHGPLINRMPAGTGPFKFVDWQDHDSLTLVRNTNYWKPGLPYLDGISVRIISDLNTVMRSVVAGQADLALNLRAEQKVAVDQMHSRGVKGLVAAAPMSMVGYGLRLNFGRPPLADVRVRQAINYALDREELNKVLQYGLGEPTSAFYPKEYWATDPDTFNYYPHDPERARKLLADVGFANGIDIDGWGWSITDAVKRQELITLQLAKAGIRVKLTATTPARVQQEFEIRRHGALQIGPCAGFVDPGEFYESEFAKDSLFNPGQVELPGFRTLLDTATSVQTLQERKAAFGKVQSFIVKNAMAAPGIMSPTVSVANEKVHAFDYGMAEQPKFTEVWLDA